MSDLYSQSIESFDLVNSILQTKVDKINTNTQFINLKKEIEIAMAQMGNFDINNLKSKYLNDF